MCRAKIPGLVGEVSRVLPMFLQTPQTHETLGHSPHLLTGKEALGLNEQMTQVKMCLETGPGLRGRPRPAG